MPEPIVIDMLTPYDEEFPKRLHDLDDTPQRLWVRGDVSLLNHDKAVAIIGARASTAYGEHVATDLACGLAEDDWTIVSGGAFGIDAAAHRGAIVTHLNWDPHGRRGRTIAVLACGVDRAYPSAHEELFDSILRAGGLIVSEYPPGSDPHRARFLERNRIIAALSGGMVMVEAGMSSGSMSAFGYARVLGRKLMVVPGPVTSAVSKGTNHQLRNPDVMPVGTAAEVMEVMKG